MEEYSIAVIGGGPSGMMSAISAANFTRGVVLLEKNACLGKKLLLSGKGRCNLTNIGDLDNFLEHFSGTGKFLRSAFAEFFNTELMNFFEDAGLKLKTERGGRVFPINDKSTSILAILKKKLEALNVQLLYNSRVKDIQKRGSDWLVELCESKFLKAKRVILATGAASYPLTGSTGDGFKIAKELGHKIIALRPGLVPLEAKEVWVRGLAGLTLENVKISILQGAKKISSQVGDMIFTHFGVSGPLVLELSSKVVDWFTPHRASECPAFHGLDECGTEKHYKMPHPSERGAGFADREKVFLKIDLKPGLSEEQLEARLIRDFKDYGSCNFKNVLKELLPKKLIDICSEIAGISPLKKANQISYQERKNLVKFLKGLGLTITNTRPLPEAIITKGGVSTKEINPKTMESLLHKGLYFCGEIIDVDADTGGYNLQTAFSSGYLAGKSAGRSLN